MLLVTCAAGCERILDIPEVTLDPCLGAAPDGGTRAGPTMVRIEAARDYCIDTTEVTVAQFNAYLLASGQHVDTPALCERALPPPLVDSDPAHADLPIGGVGECDAWSYCRWAGKRLCGAIADGGSARGVALEATEWGFACVNGRMNLPFPYGTEAKPVCATESGQAVPVGSRPECRGTVPPFDEIYDLVGNHQELINDFGTATDSIAAHGGSFRSASTTGCDAAAGFDALLFNFDDSGFRCCADVGR